MSGLDVGIIQRQDHCALETASSCTTNAHRIEGGDFRESLVHFSTMKPKARTINGTSMEGNDRLESDLGKIRCNLDLLNAKVKGGA